MGKKEFSVDFVDEGNGEVHIKVKAQGGGKAFLRKPNGEVEWSAGNDVVLLPDEFPFGDVVLSAKKMPRDTVIFTHSSPTCSFIPTPKGWVRWCR